MSKNKPIPLEHKLLTDKREITYWLNAHKVKNFYINKNELGLPVVDVFDNLNLCDTGLEKIEVQFNIVVGECNLSKNNLYYLKGSPIIVGGNFDCSNNFLQSLNGGPQEVKHSYKCSHNNLTNLIGSPAHIKNKFDSSFNRLTSLQGCPKTIKNSRFDVSHNKLENLVYFPEHMLNATDLKYNKKLGKLQELFVFEDIYEIHLAQKERINLNSLISIENYDINSAQKIKANKI